MTTGSATLAGVDVTAMIDSTSAMTEQANHLNGIADLILRDETGTLAIHEMDELLVYAGGTLCYGGRIRTKMRMRGGGTSTWLCQATTFDCLLDLRVIENGERTGTRTDADDVDFILDHCNDLGITDRTYVLTTQVSLSQDIDYSGLTCRAALQRLMGLLNGPVTYWIDHTKKPHWIDPRSSQVVTNGTFDEDAGDWTLDGDAAYDEDAGPGGTSDGCVVTTGTGSGSHESTQTYASIVADRRYLFIVDLWSSVANKAQVRVEWLTSGDASLRTDTITGSGTSTWDRHKQILVAPATAAKVTVKLGGVTDFTGTVRHDNVALFGETAPWGVSLDPDDVTTFAVQVWAPSSEATTPVNRVLVRGDGISGWRENAASIAYYDETYEGVVDDMRVTTEAGIDSRAAWMFGKYAFPCRSGTYRTDRPGLAAGQWQILEDSDGTTIEWIASTRLRFTGNGNLEWEVIYGGAQEDLATTLAGIGQVLDGGEMLPGIPWDDLVDTAQIVDGAVIQAKLDDAAVGEDQLITGSVTATKIAALAISGDHIAANAISAGHISAGSVGANELAATLILGSTIIAGDPDGARITLAGDGLSMIDSEDLLSVSLPTDGGEAYLRGSLVASGLTSEGAASFRGDVSIEPGTELICEISITTPQKEPFIQTDVPLGTRIIQPAWLVSSQGGYYDANGGADGTTPCLVVLATKLNGTATEWWVCEWKLADGTLDRSTQLTQLGGTIPGFRRSAFMTRVGSDWFFCGSQAGTTNTVLAKAPRSTGACSAWVTLNSTQAPISSEFGWNIKSDGTYVLMVHPLYSFQVRVSYWTTSCAWSSDVDLTEPSTPEGYVLNNYPWQWEVVGTDWWLGFNWWEPGTGNVIETCYKYTTAGAIVPNNEFSMDSKMDLGAFFWDGTNFQFHEVGYLWTYTNWTWTTETPIYWVAYAWYDSVGTTHETLVGPLASRTMSRRWRMRISVPTPPGSGGADDPDTVRIYVLRSATEPAPGTLRLAGTAANRVLLLTSYSEAGSLANIGTVFPPAAASGHLVPADDSNGDWLFRGDGSWVLSAGDEGWYPRMYGGESGYDEDSYALWIEGWGFNHTEMYASTYSEIVCSFDNTNYGPNVAPRLAIFGDGHLEWSEGDAAFDTTLYRKEANVLKTDDRLEFGVTTKATDVPILIREGTSNDAEFAMFGDGAMWWGAGGTTPRDANLYRDAAKVLKSNSTVSIGRRLRLPSRISPTALTANADNWNPTGLADASMIYVTTDATVRTITGIVAGTDGDILFLYNANTSTAISLVHANAGSSSTNQFVCPGSTTYSLTSRKTVMLVYSGYFSKWVLMVD